MSKRSQTIDRWSSEKRARVYDLNLAARKSATSIATSSWSPAPQICNKNGLKAINMQSHSFHVETKLGTHIRRGTTVL